MSQHSKETMMEDVLINMARLITRLHDEKAKLLDENRQLFDAGRIDRAHMQETINLLRRDNERLTQQVNVFEAEVSRLAAANEKLEAEVENQRAIAASMTEQRNHMLEQHRKVCGQRNDEISKAQRLLKMIRDVLDSEPSANEAITLVAELVNANINEE